MHIVEGLLLQMDPFPYVNRHLLCSTPTCLIVTDRPPSMYHTTCAKLIVLFPCITPHALTWFTFSVPHHMHKTSVPCTTPQAYIQLPDASVPTTTIRLGDFHRVHVRAGETVRVHLELHADARSVVYKDENVYTAQVGGGV